MNQMRKRNQNRGIEKDLRLPTSHLGEVSHSWHFDFRPKGGPSFRFSVDSEAGKHIAAKGDAETFADAWRSAIRRGHTDPHLMLRPTLEEKRRAEKECHYVLMLIP